MYTFLVIWLTLGSHTEKKTLLSGTKPPNALKCVQAGIIARGVFLTAVTSLQESS